EPDPKGSKTNEGAKTENEVLRTLQIHERPRLLGPTGDDKRLQALGVVRNPFAGNQRGVGIQSDAGLVGNIVLNERRHELRGSVAGLTPAGTFKPDINLPLNASSFNFTIPQIGGFPRSLALGQKKGASRFEPIVGGYSEDMVADPKVDPMMHMKELI